MLSPARAERLARRAARRRSDGSHGLLTRRALQRLTRAAEDGNPRAIEGLWQAWLSEPGDELWATLTRWRNPQVMAEAVVEIAAAYWYRSAANLRALGEFCVRHGLLPGDEFQRVQFCAR